MYYSHITVLHNHPSLQIYPLPITGTTFEKKKNRHVGTLDPISRKDEICHGIGSYGEMRYEPPGMLQAAVSFLVKIYDSRKEQLPRWVAINNVTLTSKVQL
jgi:hypothetical protein